ncbi:hypothetical protein [Dethiosulfatarculus sandiegensis]|uniref:amino acid kinase family protein n=1 Tax=Dethiosulfatarculus sandiegensis TaxID=1429043 RepID=UPI000696CCE2|nr:hypothetical protein [Dethiosulfatarculus sandiegensis]
MKHLEQEPFLKPLFLPSSCEFKAVLKVGGSLGKGRGLKPLCRSLGDLAEEHRLLVVPGGGLAADLVRDYDRRLGLSDDAAHWMAIMAMDQYGLLLADKIKRGRPVTSLEEAAAVAEEGLLPVMLPYAMLKAEDPLPHSWQVTSDSIAAWIGLRAGVRELVLLKSVDGLYPQEGPFPDPNRKGLLKKITLSQLASWPGVDPILARLLEQNPLGLWIINGARPERLRALFGQGKAKGTRLRA